MKNKKNPNYFVFKEKTKEDLVNEINSDLPVKLSKVGYFVEKIHEKYPVASKSEIAIVVKEVFETMREFLILGYVMNFNRLFFDTKLFFFRNQGKNLVKVQSKTPTQLKKIKDGNI